MLFIYLIVLTQLLCSTCSDEAITIDELNNTLTPSDLQINQSNGKPRLNFLDLYDDVLYIIVDRLELSELLNAAATNSRITHFARNVFRRQYQNYSIEFRNFRFDREDGKIRIANSKVIQFYDYKLALIFLRHFGDQIHKFAIYYEMYAEERHVRCNEFISKYASEAVTNLGLNYINDTLLSAFTSPFTNVEQLSGTMVNDLTGVNALSFNEMFPSVKRLKLLSFKFDFNYTFIDCHIPHLEHLLMARYPGTWSNDMLQIKSLFRKNPQIRSLELIRFPLSFPKVISELLPNIETIIIDEFDIGNETVQIDSVKNFHLTDDEWPRSIGNLKFPALQTMLTAFCYSYDNWAQFFQNQRNLTKLEILASMHTEEDELIRLVSDLPNLIELRILPRYFRSADIEGVEVITSIIRNGEKLQKFECMYCDSYDESDVERLRELLPNEWQIIEFIPEVQLTIERIN